MGDAQRLLGQDEDELGQSDVLAGGAGPGIGSRGVSTASSGASSTGAGARILSRSLIPKGTGKRFTTRDFGSLGSVRFQAPK